MDKNELPKEQAKVWDRLSETEEDRKYMDAMRSMQNMLRDAIANGEHKRKHDDD